MASTIWNSLTGRVRHTLDVGRRRRERDLLAKADRLRDAGQFTQALALYEESARLVPWDSGILIQAGHMAKEARQFALAEKYYHLAEAARPNDADLQLQMGHFCKTIDRLDAAEAHYRRALELAPGFASARREMETFDVRRGRSMPVRLLDDATMAAPELLPQPREARPIGKLDAIHMLRFGNRRIRSSAGELSVLAGVEALRGLCFVEEEIVEARVIIDDVVLCRGTARNFAAPLAGITKAVFNLWIDCSDLAPGLHRQELVLVGASGRTRSRFDFVCVTAPLLEADHPQSDAVVTPGPDEASDLDTAIRSRATVVRAAGQAALAVPQSILVLRTDQLGDMVASLPALVRLRGLFPGARIVGLLTEANVDLARTLDLFDEIIVIAFPDDFEQRRRVMPAEAQRELAERLGAYRFDIAIDLATSHVSRPLLKLAGARFTLGFDDASFPWLSAGLSGRVRAPHEDSEASPHASRPLALIERLATLTSVDAPVLRRPELDRAGLGALGIDPEAPYALIHTGARIRFSRWPHYRELAEALHAETGLTIAVLADQEDLVHWASCHPGIRPITGRLPFDDLDRLLSFTSLFIGNDSGPKHLAALRGVPVLSIHSARIHWLEWGQRQTGLIMSRRVPCAGCAIFHDEDECGKDHACVTDIRMAEVLSAAMSLLGRSTAASASTNSDALSPRPEASC